VLHNPVKRYKRKEVFKGYCYTVVVDEVLWPNRKRVKRDLIVHPGISIWIPLLDQNRMVLIRQYRYGAGKVLWELPAGTIAPHESPLACAKREIEEEIGYRASRWKKIITCFASPGYTTEVIHGFIARNLTPVPARPEQDEIIESSIFTVKQVRAMIKKRQIQDARSLALLFYYLYDRGEQ
jgi:ADP-ribose pyrophosphatase